MKTSGFFILWCVVLLTFQAWTVSAWTVVEGGTVSLTYESRNISTLTCPINGPPGFGSRDVTSNSAGSIQLNSVNSSHSGTYTITCTGSPVLGYGVVSASDTLTVNVASGSISASPNPCTIPAGAATCTSTISWNTSNTPTATVAVTGGALFAGGTSGSQAAPWIGVNATTFYLQSNTGSTLALVSVYGVCAAGTIWNGGSCATTPDPVVNLYLSP